MVETIKDIQTESTGYGLHDVANSSRGGARKGAGRPVGSRNPRNDERWLRARGINPVHAAEVLARVGSELARWDRLLNSEDDRVVLAAMQFLVSMRDGRPAQQINMTSLNLSVSADDVESARAIVRELRGDSPNLRGRTEGEHSPKALMLSEGDGGTEGGLEG